MMVSTVTWGSTLLMRMKLLMMSYGFGGRGEEFSWLDMPSGVLELIISKLPFEDRARMACVCKSWRDIIQTPLAFYPVGGSPLLVSFKSRGEDLGNGTVFYYYSPLVNKAFKQSYPVSLRGYEIISAINGNLLMYNQGRRNMRLVDPLNLRLYDLAHITSNISFNGTAIGRHDNSYTIFLIDTSHENEVTIHLYKQGNWALDVVYGNGERPFDMLSNPVYCDGRFYCLGKGNRLGVFCSTERTWRIHNVEFVNKYYHDDNHHHRCCCCSYYLVGLSHGVMAVRVDKHGSEIQLFRLDRKKMVWVEFDELGGRSLFFGSTLSVMTLPTAKMLRNRVFLPHFHQGEIPGTKTVIDADIHRDFQRGRFYFRSKSSSISSNHAAAAATTTTICCCDNSGEESLYLHSIQNQIQNHPTIWYQPLYKGPVMAKTKRGDVCFILKKMLLPLCLFWCLLFSALYLPLTFEFFKLFLPV